MTKREPDEGRRRAREVRTEVSTVSEESTPRERWIVDPSGVRWREVMLFGVLGLALCAVFVVVLLLLGIDSRQVSLWGMLTPAIAAFIVVWWRQRGKGFGAIARATSMWPLRPGRTVAYCLIVLFGSVGVGLVTALCGAAIGLMELDLQNFSGLRTALADVFPGVAADGAGFPAWWPLLLWLLLQMAGIVIWIPLSFGEELGWRGYLVPALMPLGIGRVLVVSCTYWVLWHLPLILYSVEFEGVGDILGWSAVFVFAQAAPQVVVITWLRLASGSVWPAVLLHATTSLITVGGTIVAEVEGAYPVISVGGQRIELANLVFGAVGVVLIVTGQLRVRPDDPAIPTGTAIPDTRAGFGSG